MKRLNKDVDYKLFMKAYSLLYHVKVRARKKKLACDLDVDWILSRMLNGKCEVTKLPFKLDRNGLGFHARHTLTPSVDRVNSKLGYTKDNCRLVIWWYNNAKSTHSDLDLWHLCSAVSSLNVHNAPFAPQKAATEVKIT